MCAKVSRKVNPFIRKVCGGEHKGRNTVKEFVTKESINKI